jgi:hypothetical protein
LVYFLKGQANFETLVQKSGDILDYFYLKQVFFYIFTILSTFKAWFVVGILRVRKWFDVDVLGFQIEFRCRYFGIF